jgi:hypothetical protein
MAEFGCCDDEGAALAFGQLAATSPAGDGLDDAGIPIDDLPGDCAVDDGDNDEVRFLDAKPRSRALKLSLVGGPEAPLILTIFDKHNTYPGSTYKGTQDLCSQKENPSI